MAGDIGLSVVGKIAELMIEPIQRELGYLFCFNNNFQELETQLCELKAKRNDVQGREDAEKRMRKTLGECVELWIENANGKIIEADIVVNEKAGLQKGCFSIIWCPNIRLRFSLGRKGKKLTLDLKDLLQKGGNLLLIGHALPVPFINMGDYNGDACDFKSRSKIVEDIVEMLRDQETMLIGLCGMGGIGKTTLAKQVLQKVLDFHKHLFDNQIILTVSNNPNFDNIQQEVAEMLGSSIQEIKSEILRAQHLRDAISKKKVVILLDDVWKEFDLNAKGFPLTKSIGGNFCKIIYTSRTQDLWSGERTITKQEIFLQVLSGEEALNLFNRKVDLHRDDVDFHLKNKIGRKIVDECKGLPLALEVAGGALVKKNKYAWEDMLFKLQSQQLHSDKIHKILETSYDYLEDPNAKLLFLLCCLFQEDKEIPIQTLYRYAVGLQLFKGMNDLKHISHRVYTLIDDLTRKNLLINVENLKEQGCVVKMHDVVRDVGISIAKQQENGFSFIVCDGDQLENIVSPHTKMISIMIPESSLNVLDKMEFIRGSKLELLRLDSSSFDRSNDRISESFIQGADNLKVLDIIIQGATYEFPCSSFPYLAKAKMLSLVGLCLDMTTNVSSILHLSCLEVLSFQNSTMKIFPNEISELRNLRLLDLTGCKCFISNGVLSRLTNLQELYMWDSFHDWRLPKEDVDGGNNSAAGLNELNCLHKLWRLELVVSNIEQVPRGNRLFSSSTLLEQFKIRIGGRKRYTEFESGERQLWLENVKEDISFELCVLIEKGITNLCLFSDSGMLEKMHLSRFLSLKDIIIKHCGSIINLFPHLQSSLQISDIEEMSGIGRYLQRIEIYYCKQVRHLCSTSISRNLTNLQVLVLDYCEMMEEVFYICDETEQLRKIEFNALKTLKISYLSRMECFTKGINEIHFRKLKILELKGLEQYIFPTQMEIPCLEQLSIISVSNIKTLCNIVAPSLKELYIKECDSLRYVFSTSFMTSISHLKILIIKECKMLKGVIGVSNGVEEQGEKSIEFPNLKILCFEYLEEFASFVIDINNLSDEEEMPQQTALFYHDGDEVSFPCLEILSIIGLSKINYIVGWKCKGGQQRHHHDIEEEVDVYDKRLPVLAELSLYRLSNLIHIYEINHLRAGLEVLLFQNLRNMSLGNCDKLRYLFSENIGRVTAKHLKNLNIYECPLMVVVMKNDEEILEDDDKAGGGVISLENIDFFPLLRILSFWDLPSLRSFCDIAYTWALPSLLSLSVLRCPKLEALSPGYLDSPRLKTLCYDNRDELNAENTWKGDINTELRHLFIKK